MSQQVVLQTPEQFNQRMLDQLRNRKVDVGQYFGGPPTAHAWATLADRHPMKDIIGLPLDGQGGVTVIDLGPGSGKPCVAAIAPFRDRVRVVVCVDASSDMAEQAARHIHAETSKEVHCIVADFLRDAFQLRKRLDAYSTQKVFMCLGGTIGNFSQKYAFGAIRSLLSNDDRLLLGLGLYDPEQPDKELKALGDFFASEVNCRFGLSFLKASGCNPDHRQAHSRCEDDPEEKGVKVVRGFYRFLEDTTLAVGDESVLFRQGEELQFVESRRYPRGAVVPYLRMHGFEILDFRDFERHGLYLCRPDSPTTPEAL